MKKQPPLQLAGQEVAPGERRTLQLPAARLYTQTEMNLPLHVVHGRQTGPRLLVCAAVHGDEINGVEIIRRLLQLNMLDRLRGTLLAIPVVNIYGFIHHSRYLPDRRDLNRAFPGSRDGSLTSAMAHLLTTEVLIHCTHGIDLHTGANHRSNLPQIRASLDQPATEAMARAFGAPVIIDARVRDGSIRAEATDRGVPWLTYEAGEALRFDEYAITAGLRGILATMRAIGQLPASRSTRQPPAPLITRSTTWVRAPASGVIHAAAALGTRVAKGQQLCAIGDPLGEQPMAVCAPCDGIIIGRLDLPLAHQGDALFHLALLHHDDLKRTPDLLSEADFAAPG